MIWKDIEYNKKIEEYKAWRKQFLKEKYEVCSTEFLLNYVSTEDFNNRIFTTITDRAIMDELDKRFKLK